MGVVNLQWWDSNIHYVLGQCKMATKEILFTKWHKKSNESVTGIESNLGGNGNIIEML